jgi:hypothetical protein
VKVLIYFDLCALHRPHDLQTQVRVQLETVAVLAVLQHCRNGGADICSSDTLVFEAGRNPNPVPRSYVEGVLSATTAYQSLTAEVEARAEELGNLGL